MISVLLYTVDPGKFERASLHYRQALSGEEIEVIGATGASMAAAYNRQRDRFHGDIVLFCHEDVEILSSHTAERLRKHLLEQDLVGVTGTTRLVCAIWNGAGPPYAYGQVAMAGSRAPYDVHIYSAPMPLIPQMEALAGPLMVARRAVVHAIPFDEHAFDGATCYDVDFSYAAFRAGLRLAVATDISILDLSLRLIDKKWEADMMTFMQKWGVVPKERLRDFLFARAEVHSKKEILEVMTASG